MAIVPHTTPAKTPTATTASIGNLLLIDENP